MPLDFDDIRKRLPALGMSVFAMEPGGVVTLEVYDGDEVYSWTGATLADCFQQAFKRSTRAPQPVENDIFS